MLVPRQLLVTLKGKRDLDWLPAEELSNPLEGSGIFSCNRADFLFHLGWVKTDTEIGAALVVRKVVVEERGLVDWLMARVERTR